MRIEVVVPLWDTRGILVEHIRFVVRQAIQTRRYLCISNLKAIKVQKSSNLGQKEGCKLKTHNNWFKMHIFLQRKTITWTHQCWRVPLCDSTLKIYTKDTRTRGKWKGTRTREKMQGYNCSYNDKTRTHVRQINRYTRIRKSKNNCKNQHEDYMQQDYDALTSRFTCQDYLFSMDVAKIELAK